LNPSYLVARDLRGSLLEASLGKMLIRPISINKPGEGAGEVAQVVECLPSKCGALSSNPI
jgi:hypothetical protein